MRWAVLGIVAVAVAAVVIARETYISRKIAAGTAPQGPVARSFGGDWPQAAGPRVLLIGDSIVSGWRFHMPRGLTVVERGLPGETAAQLARRFPADAGGADIVVVHSGLNDLVTASLMPPDDRAAMVRAMHDAWGRIIAEAGRTDACLVLATLIPPAEPPLVRRLVWNPQVLAMTEDANRTLRALAAPPKVSVLDLAVMLPPGIHRDTLHLTAEGYRAMNAALAEHVAGLDMREC